ncbi:helix-turn-helix domain-containing protein [Emticicia sp. ODNR4P]|jgi:AraC family transcriptional regulator|nr:helix-turn-helix domain-containing protein [Emticicia sp. ODNR4P]
MSTLNKGEYSGNILNLVEFEGIITSKTAYHDKVDQSYHYHANPHLSFIINGAHLERKNNQTAVKTSKDVLFYHSGEFHQTIPFTPDTKNLNLEIDSYFLQKHDISEELLEKAVLKNVRSKLFMLKLNSELNFNDGLTQTALHSLILDFVAEADVKDYQQILWCTKLEEFLNDNWNLNHSLEELSILLGVHPVTISKHFPKYIGCTIGEYVRRIRITRSLDLLKSSNQSLTEIALFCGFSDQSHFLRTFKHMTGLNPKSFRNF